MNIDIKLFNETFREATGHSPFPYQERLATASKLPDLIDIPTGAGKTAAVVLAWLWRRRFATSEIRNQTPRRLVYCLPMRVLVEQTRDNAILWLERLGLFGGTVKLDGDKNKVLEYEPSWDDSDRICVTVLMGGEDKDEWDLYPERDAIIIGTQDMLLSRALNRGYGMSRYRWPVHFGLLNNDCLWVMDEVQLMGNGLKTSSQMEAFRTKFGVFNNCRTIWMSATINHSWLNTVDFTIDVNDINITRLGTDDKTQLSKTINCTKILSRAGSLGGDFDNLANEIIKNHVQETRTIAIINTVVRAVELFNILKKKKPKADTILIHSHFRPSDRKKALDKLLSSVGPEGAIIVSTQVIEAGVDVSARTLFTELAPWSSLIQRLGRCNRYGEYKQADVFWIDLPYSEKDKFVLPYTKEEMEIAKKALTELEQKGVSPVFLPAIETTPKSSAVIRQKDVLELFDTTTDMTGHDIDISQFIRDSDNTNVQVFWRNVSDKNPGNDESEPFRDELCPAPIQDLRNLIKKKAEMWRWDYFDGNWVAIRDANTIFPGQTILMRCSDGHYNATSGWNLKEKKAVDIIPIPTTKNVEKYDKENTTNNTWMTIAEHTEQVVNKTIDVSNALINDITLRNIMKDAARWHDSGKAHPCFQAMVNPEKIPTAQPIPIAKAPTDAWLKGRLPNNPVSGDIRRKHFRHELASGALALLNGKNDLTAYLAAAHHGKVRVSIRSMPNEYTPDSDNTRYARGVWDGDIIPETDLGDGVILPKTEINLSFMDLGTGVMGPSWSERMLAFYDKPDLGIFRLGFLEAIIKVADERASKECM